MMKPEGRKPMTEELSQDRRDEIREELTELWSAIYLAQIVGEVVEIRYDGQLLDVETARQRLTDALTPMFDGREWFPWTDADGVTWKWCNCNDDPRREETGSPCGRCDEVPLLMVTPEFDLNINNERV